MFPEASTSLSRLPVLGDISPTAVVAVSSSNLYLRHFPCRFLSFTFRPDLQYLDSALVPVCKLTVSTKQLKRSS